MLARVRLTPATLFTCLALSACAPPSGSNDDTAADGSDTKDSALDDDAELESTEGGGSSGSSPDTSSTTNGSGTSTGSGSSGSTSTTSTADPGTSTSTSGGEVSSNDTTGETGEPPDSDGGPLPGDGYPEHRGAGCNVSAGEYGAENANLPNPFQMNDGTVISTMAEWECRRAEIVNDLEEYEVGPKPPPPQVEATFSGGTLTVNVTTDDGSLTLTSNISGSGDCVVIGMGSPSSFVNGCRSMAFAHDQVVRNDHSSGNAWPDDPYYRIYPHLYEEAPYGGSQIENGNLLIGNYSAWSWGVSRLIDGLEQTQDQHGIDLSKIAVHGCSYAGKMALWAGALDQRIALTIAQESGGGGAPSWRTSQDYEDRGGGQVESIDDTNWAWFKDSLLNSREPHLLPHDHHELIALVAPRPFLVLPGDPGNAWLGAESAYVSFMAAREVWTAMGVADHAGLVVHDRGGAHCSASGAQRQAAQAFADRFLLGQSTNTDIVSGFDTDWRSVVDWETPSIPNP